MPFIHNALVLQHEPSGFSYIFDAVRALHCVHGVRDDVQHMAMDCAYASQHTDTNETYHRPRRRLSQSGVQVSYAKKWGESRQHALSSTTASSTPQVSMTKPYDWTYSTTWPGQPGKAAPVDIYAQNAAKTERTIWEPCDAE
ncbi:hypothetical protein MGL_2130 [Malassezia globosa CBS 7966]|uniref:Uncharacterized protein n=1 Tax=Malassezia globosa (strain ATCC MYA-4612 / CBS 7966) TaxID=425265 RepID=A8Q245_MALGO|nr:uncharacterized protein MGL_2130 [Malassezia globosa CBS 7966]EDP43462.1 hypothetical protein MGL_2130 [Malassezia globosa CBS 7966]